MPTIQVTIELECSFARPSARDIEDREATIDGVYDVREVYGWVQEIADKAPKFTPVNTIRHNLFDGCDMKDPQIQRVLLNLNEAFQEEVREACEARE